MFKRLTLFTLTLVLTLGLLVVPALAGTCNHRHTDDCMQLRLVCTKEEHTHHWWSCGLIFCDKEEHQHYLTTCYVDEPTNCKHVHDETCGYYDEEVTEEPDPTPDPEPTPDPKPEQPAAPAGSNFIEPTYYADYEEDVTYLDPEKAEAADYVVICRTLNVRKTPSTEFAPIAKIHRGDIVSVVDWVGDWAKIEWATAEDGYAYVYGAYIEKI